MNATWGPPDATQRAVEPPAPPLTTPRRFAVIDCETTGLYNHDRVVEVAVVIVDASTSQVVHEYDSLINPMRDPGPVGLHGISPAMLQLAPTFDEIAGALAHHLEGSVLVAHNLPFDTRMLGNEFERLGARLDSGLGVCTLSLTGERLNLACQRFDVPLTHHHRALADARATAELLRRVLDEEPATVAAHVDGVSAAFNSRTYRRDASGDDINGSMLQRLVAAAPYPTSDGALLCYLDALDWVLDDLVITSTERVHLEELARSLGLSATEMRRAHEAYLSAMITAATRDSMVTSEERSLMQTVASVLGLAEVVIPEVTPAVSFMGLPPGATICFTGAMSMLREDLELIATRAGLRPISSVTKTCQVLVSADPASMSGKAKKARQYGIPIIDEQAFLNAVAS
jgi:DNA polymerase-3 subunit epsilon